MESSRNIFVFTGNPLQVQSALDALDLEGLTVLKDAGAIRTDDIHAAFTHNKSVACPTFSKFERYGDSVLVHVFDKPTHAGTPDYIVLNSGNISEQFKKIASMHNCYI